VLLRAAERKMLFAIQNRLGAFGALALVAGFFAFLEPNVARAQEPPQTIPKGGPPPADPNAIHFDGWQLYPSLETFSQYSNNYFLTTPGKIAGWSFGLSPAVTAEWSNGIHATTLYGNFTHIEYPTDNQVITSDGEATITQQYAPLRDLNFSILGDYTHHTLASALTSAIPSPVASTASTTLPNGNIVLPNGTIITPSGQVVGQIGPTFNVGTLSVVNPYDAFTATGKVQKLFGDGIVTLATSFLRQDYEEQLSQSRDFTAKTFSEDAAFWVGPILYIYSSGAFTLNDNTNPVPNSDVYRVVGGLGTHQFGLFRASAYFGHQGSQSLGFPWAGGNVYGGTFTYYPTPIWTIGANLDVTINLAPAGALPSTEALSIPISTPLQVSLSSSTHTTTSTLTSEYRISPVWTANALFGYSNIQYLYSPLWQDAWFGTAMLKYDIHRNVTLTIEYQYASIVSNIPFTSANRNFVSMSASYKF